MSFQIDDAESDWNFARNSLDLIHIRHLNGGIRDWGKLIKQSFECVSWLFRKRREADHLSNSALKPGGWLDVAEYEMRLKSDDGTLRVDSNLFRFYDLMNRAADKLGKYSS